MMKKGYFLVALGASCWGTLGAIGTVLFNQGLSSIAVANYRVLFATVIIGLYLLLFRRQDLTVSKKQLPLFIAAGFISVFIFNFSYLTAINLTTIVTAVIMLYTAPTFVTVISKFAFNEPITLQKAAALILTLVGCALVVEAYDFTQIKLNFPGLLAGLSSGLTYGLYSIFGKKALDNCSPWTTVFYSFVFGSIFLSIFGRPWETFAALQNTTTASFILLIAVLPTVVAYGFYTTGLKYIESSKASIIATVEPVVAVILAAAVFHENISLLQGLGILLVIGSIILIQISLPAKNEDTAEKSNQCVFKA